MLLRLTSGTRESVCGSISDGGDCGVAGAPTSIKESVVSNCTMRDTIIGDRSTLTSCVLTDSMIGDQVLLEGVKGSVSLGDHTEVRAPQI